MYYSIYNYTIELYRRRRRLFSKNLKKNKTFI